MSAQTAQLTNSVIISQSWTALDPSVDVERYLPFLKDCGEEIALNAFAKGERQGQMSDNIHHFDDDPEDGVDFRGSWTLEEKEIPIAAKGSLSDEEAFCQLKDGLQETSDDEEYDALVGMIDALSCLLPEGALSNYITENHSEHLSGE
ncbi:hypothetical protein [Neptuniibacter sp. QD37_11]|uniref:hypothetical protein n=1 Tax=Neptuniibacter sp. QD37_11 TaxID=3398209 RepID=UPI0039F5AEA5